jgi:membrane-bound metal-dependent hydrolase YbcI (DUF457 family)
MNVITHALAGWVLASAVPGLTRIQKAAVVAAGVVPDLDGLGIVVELATRDSAQPRLWWSEYHHLLGHNVLACLVVTLVAWGITRRALTAVLAAASFLLHLLGDLVGSRGPDGYQWPLPYLWPFAEEPALTLSWQWQLNAWPNLLLSLALLGYTLWLAERTGSSPLELVSARANQALVSALQARFGKSHRQPGPTDRSD